MAEWLRRQTWNLLGSPRAGSNPADYDWHFFSLFLFKIILVQKDKWRKSLLLVVHSVVVAEWLRRQTRNLLGSPRAGSNPADYDWHFFSLFLFKIILVQKDKWRKSLLLVVHSVVVAEWLRRQTRNLLGSPRAGSNPADYDWQFFVFFSFKIILVQKDKWRKSFLLVVHSVVVAEWLRRQTRNLLGSPRAGSNPAGTTIDNSILRLLFVQNHLVLKDNWRKSFLLVVHSVVVAKWLRRQTRNLLGYSRAGSNPTIGISFPCFYSKLF